MRRANVGLGHLPFSRTYDSSHPEFLTKDQIAAAHAEYAKRYGIVSGTHWAVAIPG